MVFTILSNLAPIYYSSLPWPHFCVLNHTDLFQLLKHYGPLICAAS